MQTHLITIATTLALTGGTALAETWHVATTGDDAGDGSAASPWRTLQRAADAVAPGDTVVVHAGSYAGFRLDTRGTQRAPIAFVAEGDVTISGDDAGDGDTIHLDGAAHVRIEGFYVTGATRAGIGLEHCEHVTIRGNRVDQNGRWGVFSSFCDDLLIEDNQASRSGREHGIYVSNSGDRPVIRDNVIFGNARCGVHMNGDIHFGGDGVISGAIVEGNVILDNGEDGGSGINGDGITGALIRNNLLDGNHASGISLYRIDGGAPSTGNRVINNTVRMAGDGRWALNIQDGSGGNTARNNILLHPDANVGAINLCSGCGSGFVSDHNVVVGRFEVGGAKVDLAGWRSRTGQDQHSIEASDGELFVDAAGGDLALRAGSPAIDRGTATDAPAADLHGTARPQGAGVDVGALEWCDGACPAPGDGDGGDGDGDGDGGGGGDGGDGDPGADPGAGGDPDPEPAAAGCSAGGGAPGTLAALGLGLAAVAARRRRSRS